MRRQGRESCLRPKRSFLSLQCLNRSSYSRRILPVRDLAQHSPIPATALCLTSRASHCSSAQLAACALDSVRSSGEKATRALHAAQARSIGLPRETKRARRRGALRDVKRRPFLKRSTSFSLCPGQPSETPPRKRKKRSTAAAGKLSAP